MILPKLCLEHNPLLGGILRTDQSRTEGGDSPPPMRMREYNPDLLMARAFYLKEEYDIFLMECQLTRIPSLRNEKKQKKSTGTAFP